MLDVSYQVIIKDIDEPYYIEVISPLSARQAKIVKLGLSWYLNPNKYYLEIQEYTHYI